jgi:protocatechuate 3,4-dioxygenase beta subunit
MERKDFLKGMGLIGLGTMALPIINACTNDDHTTTNPIAASCDVAPSETEGPFPTHAPATLVTNDIRSDRTGILLSVNIHVKNHNAADAALAGAIVDIWHCDKDGNYSEYGGSGMQPTNYTAVHFLRGRQTTNADGLVSFTTIFPGWYNGRATHIHVHIYNSSGISLVVTQIAFPEGTNSAVTTVNASSANGYTKGMNGYTYNANDNVFSDSAACELGTVSGTVADGYVLESTIKVSA